MKMDKANGVRAATEKLGLRYLGAIPFDPKVEDAIGNETKLLSTAVGVSTGGNHGKIHFKPEEGAVKMSCTKAVIFDYVGTLVNCKGYSMDASKDKLYKCHLNEGFELRQGKFHASL